MNKGYPRLYEKQNWGQSRGRAKAPRRVRATRTGLASGPRKKGVSTTLVPRDMCLSYLGPNVDSPLLHAVVPSLAVALFTDRAEAPSWGPPSYSGLLKPCPRPSLHCQLSARRVRATGAYAQWICKANRASPSLQHGKYVSLSACWVKEGSCCACALTFLLSASVSSNADKTAFKPQTPHQTPPRLPHARPVIAWPTARCPMSSKNKVVSILQPT